MSEKEGDEDYQKKAQEFVTKLVEFHEKSGTPLRRIPTLGGRELDVYHLYEKVKSLGGQEAVSQARLWGEVARSFKLPASVTSASYAVRQHYIKLLDKYEIYEQDPDNYFDSVHAISQSTPSPAHKPNYRPAHIPLVHIPGYVPGPKLPIPPLPRVTFSTTYPSAAAPPIHIVQPPSVSLPASGSAQYTGTSVRDKSTGYDRVARSLLSGYPNEVDLAFNVLTVLAYKAPGALPTAELPRLVGLMLAHVAVFPSSQLHGAMGLETLYHECWYPPDSGTDFLEFWALTVPEWVCAAAFSDYHHISCHQHNGLFASRCDDSTWAVESYRVCQVATIFSNLVLLSKFVTYLAKHDDVLRFLLLASSCSLPVIQSTAMDVLIEIGPYLIAPTSSASSSPPSSPRCYSPRPYSPRSGYPPSPCEAQHPLELLVRSMFESLMGQDRAIVLKSLEVLTQTSLDPSNQALLAIMGKGVWQHVFKLLLLPDVQVLLLCLDLLYAATSDNSPVAPLITSVFRWCDILVSLLSIDVRSFGEQALSKIQVLRVSPASAVAAHSISNATPTPAKPPQHTASMSSRGVVTSTNASLPIKVGSNIIKMGSIPTSKILNASQTTIRIGNLVIPVVTATSPMALGQVLTSSASSQGQVNTTPTSSLLQNRASAPQGQGISLAQGLPHSSTIMPGLRMSSPLTIQQLQSLLSRANIPGATPPVNSSRSSLIGGSSGSSVSINRSATGGSGVTIRKVEIVPGASETKDKPLSNLLRSYLAKTGPSSSPSGSSPGSSHRDVSPASSTNITTSHSTRTTPSPTPSSLSSSSASLSASGSLVEAFAIHWLEGNYEECPGSYVSHLEMYSLYLLASTKAGINNTLNSTEFNALLRKVFVNALSTRVSVGSQGVSMMAGLAKKRSPTFSESQRESLTILTSQTTTATTRATSSSMQTCVTSLTTTSASQPVLTSLGKTGYSTMSPLAVASKAERVRLKETMPSDLVGSKSEDAPPTDSVRFGSEESMETRSEEVPPSNSMETRSEEAPPSDSMEMRSEEAPPRDSVETGSQEALSKLEEASRSVSVETNSEKAPPSDSTEAKSDEAPPSDSTEAKSDEAPPSDSMESKSEEAPPSETKSEEAPPSETKSDEAPPSDSMKTKSKEALPPSDLMETRCDEAPPTNTVESMDVDDTVGDDESTVDRDACGVVGEITADDCMEVDHGMSTVEMEEGRGSNGEERVCEDTGGGAGYDLSNAYDRATESIGEVGCVSEADGVVEASEHDNGGCGDTRGDEDAIGEAGDVNEAVCITDAGNSEHGDVVARGNEVDVTATEVGGISETADASNNGCGDVVARDDEGGVSVSQGCGNTDDGNVDAALREDGGHGGIGRDAGGEDTDGAECDGAVRERGHVNEDEVTLLNEDDCISEAGGVEGTGTTEGRTVGASRSVSVTETGDIIEAGGDVEADVTTSKDGSGYCRSTADDMPTSSADHGRYSDPSKSADDNSGVFIEAGVEDMGTAVSKDVCVNEKVRRSVYEGKDDLRTVVTCEQSGSRDQDYNAGKDHQDDQSPVKDAIKMKVGVAAGDDSQTDGEDAASCGGMASPGDDSFSDGMDCDGATNDEAMVIDDEDFVVGVAGRCGVTNGGRGIVVFNGLQGDDDYDDDGVPRAKKLRLSLDEDIEIEDVRIQVDPIRASIMTTVAMPTSGNGNVTKGREVISHYVATSRSTKAPVTTPTSADLPGGGVTKVAPSSSVSSLSSGWSSCGEGPPPEAEWLRGIHLQPSSHTPGNKRMLDSSHSTLTSKRPRTSSSAGATPPIITTPTSIGISATPSLPKVAAIVSTPSKAQVATPSTLVIPSTLTTPSTVAARSTIATPTTATHSTLASSSTLTTPSKLAIPSIQTATMTPPSELATPSMQTATMTTPSTPAKPLMATPSTIATPTTTTSSPTPLTMPSVITTTTVILSSNSSPSLPISKVPSSSTVSSAGTPLLSTPVLSKSQAMSSVSLGGSTHLTPVSLSSSSRPVPQVGASLFLTPRISSPQLVSRSPAPSVARQPSLPPPSTSLPKSSVTRSSSTPPASIRTHSSPSGSSTHSSDSGSHSSSGSASLNSHSSIAQAVSGDTTDGKLSDSAKRIICHWDQCLSLHSSWSSLLAHLSHSHISTLSFPCPCAWAGCTSKVKRHRASMLSHLQACHSADCGPSFVPPNIPRILARLKAVPSLQNETENPLTKAARLTAALILRNLARQLPEARRKLRCYEHVLCQVALSESEAGSVISHCLQLLSADK